MQGLVRRLRYCRASRPIEQQIAAITWQKETVSSNAAYLCGREMAEWCACNCEIQRGEGRWNGYRVCIVVSTVSLVDACLFVHSGLGLLL